MDCWFHSLEMVVFCRWRDLQLNECIACTCEWSCAMFCDRVQSPRCEHLQKRNMPSCCVKCSQTSEMLNQTSTVSLKHSNTCTDQLGNIHQPNSSLWKLDDCTSCHYDLSSGAVCIHNSNIYGLNEEFRDGPCRNCSCRLGRGGGHLECTELQCPRCLNPVPIPGDACCPSCRDSELYLFEGQTEVMYKKAINQTDFSNSNHLVLYAVGLTAGVFIIALCLLAMLFVLKWIKENANKKRNRGVNFKGRQTKIENYSKHCSSINTNVSLLSSNSETSTPSTSLTGCSANSNSLKLGYNKKV
uniref:VWFC domain-containing protein n=1 Tax=Ditylenchus dipsaci TaxID=166011 RepID=A0A915D2M8_9BILA